MKHAALFLLMLVPAGSAAQETPAANQVALKKADRILFYGDSLTSKRRAGLLQFESTLLAPQGRP